MITGYLSATSDAAPNTVPHGNVLFSGTLSVTVVVSKLTFSFIGFMLILF